KGLNGGYAPLSAVIARQSIVETIREAGGNFMHAQTYSHNPLACAAGLAVQRYIEQHDLVERAARVGAELGETLRSIESDLIGDVRGIGMLWAVEFVADRESKRPFPRELKLAETLVEKAKQRGLVVWPNVGHADGENGDLVMIAPPFTIEPAQIGEIAELLHASLNDTAQQLLTSRH
ncbi:MAG TPA: aminotransferase class III-fold pyridoxal phosphate-dependent enzyme, partial [Candidatus Baltobacteraceae bacterium]|nr:aminotransferase class III-fold pyridoxal phosphate-dependent enzyme [Candidatus Baltobacteraceae bacterium]